MVFHGKESLVDHVRDWDNCINFKMRLQTFERLLLYSLSCSLSFKNSLKMLINHYNCKYLNLNLKYIKESFSYFWCGLSSDSWTTGTVLYSKCIFCSVGQCLTDVDVIFFVYVFSRYLVTELYALLNSFGCFVQVI